MHAVGVDIGGTKIAAGVVDDAGRILAQARRDTVARDAASIDAAIAEVVTEFAADFEFDAVGLAAAGFVSSDRETVIFGPNIAAWRDYPLAANVKAAIGTDVRVVVENDANAAAYAEYAFGAGREATTLIMLTIGTGLGGGIVIDGQLLRGAYGFAAELGHVRAVPDGHLCGCGHRGCWEQYTSGSALVREARRHALESPDMAAGILAAAKADSPDGIKGPHVTQAALAGDPLAVSLLAELGTWIGEACASFAGVIDPDAFVIGGGVVAAGDLLLAPARDAFVRSVPAQNHRTVPLITPAAMGNDAGIVGAAALARGTATPSS